MTNEQETTSERVVRVVQSTRKRLGWSAGRLAEECAKHGHPEVTDQVIYNLEQRRREEVTVDQLVAFSKALLIPPNMLLGPSGHTAGLWFPTEESRRAFSDALGVVMRGISWLATPEEELVNQAVATQVATPEEEGT
jgi:hypothetical protein